MTKIRQHQIPINKTLNPDLVYIRNIHWMSRNFRIFQTQDKEPTHIIVITDYSS